MANSITGEQNQLGDFPSNGRRQGHRGSHGGTDGRTRMEANGEVE